MSAGIKRMLAEREANAERERVVSKIAQSPKKLEEVQAAMKMIDLAQPFIDRHATDPKKWPPSALLRIGYCLIGTGPNPGDAPDFVKTHLDIARDRMRGGFDPNPFGEPRLGQATKGDGL